MIASMRNAALGGYTHPKCGRFLREHVTAGKRLLIYCHKEGRGGGSWLHRLEGLSPDCHSLAERKQLRHLPGLLVPPPFLLAAGVAGESDRRSRQTPGSLLGE